MPTAVGVLQPRRLDPRASGLRNSVGDTVRSRRRADRTPTRGAEKRKTTNWWPGIDGRRRFVGGVDEDGGRRQLGG